VRDLRVVLDNGLSTVLRLRYLCPLPIYMCLDHFLSSPLMMSYCFESIVLLVLLILSRDTACTLSPFYLYVRSRARVIQTAPPSSIFCMMILSSTRFVSSLRLPL
jgi:hypothetical protein